MQQPELRKFMERFFLNNHCQIMESSPGHLTIQLTIEMDKLLMNRPFYWHYQEKIGGNPQPMKLTLYFDPNMEQKEKGDLVHFGSPRAHQIFSEAKNLGAFIRLFEQVQTHGVRTSLHPWLNVNAKIKYLCDRSMEKLVSVGLNLISGEIVYDFYDYANKKSFTKKIPDFCFTLSPLITPKSGLNRIKKSIEDCIFQEDLGYFEEAKKKWQSDLKLLNAFFVEEKRESNEEYQREVQALKDLYEPRVEVEVINGGLYYLTTHEQQFA